MLKEEEHTANYIFREMKVWKNSTVSTNCCLLHGFLFAAQANILDRRICTSQNSAINIIVDQIQIYFEVVSRDHYMHIWITCTY